MNALLLLIALMCVSWALAQLNPDVNHPNHIRSHDDDDGSDDDDTVNMTDADDDDDDGVHLKPWRQYDQLSDSSREPLRNEPYYVARMQQPKIKKWFKMRANMTKAYCFGEFEEECNRVLCDATKSLREGALADHFDWGNCAGLSGVSGGKNGKSINTFEGEASFWRRIPRDDVATFLDNKASHAKQLCHKTKHTTDDRCKNKVECLILEGLTDTWPQLFALKACSSKDLENYDYKQNKDGRAARALAKKKAAKKAAEND